MAPSRPLQTSYRITYCVRGKDLADWDGEDPFKVVKLGQTSTDEEALRKFKEFKAELIAKGTDHHSLCLLKVVELFAEF